MNESKKYCRSLHAQISLGTTSDDRFMPDGYVSAFAKMEKLVLTEKLDGQNNCFNKHGVFARSHAAPTKHPWDKPLIERWQLIKNDLQDLEIFGENMYGIHSIAYNNLESYFYVFAVRELDQWLSWEEVKFYANLLEFPAVPEIKITSALSDFSSEYKNENQTLSEWLNANLGMTWEEHVKTPGLLGGYDPNSNKDCSEGFVIRNASSFKTNEGEINVASNEFNNLFKLVRKSHVKTDVHLTKNWKPSILVDYEKYNWLNYSYLKSK
ncbi:MAG: RNA ligase family protein [Saprospiraceae bacterium]